MITISEKTYLKLVKLAYEDIKFNCKNRNWLNASMKNYKKKSVYVVLFDLNYLKKINDTKGHNAGDNYISKFIKNIKDFLKDLSKYELVRLGGDEFLLLSNNYISKKNISKFIKNTASFGIAKSKKNENLHFAIKESDKKMYKMKENFHKKYILNNI